MDKYDSFIDEDKHGLHCVLFSNRSALDKNEVEERFSEFGNVVNVKFHGGDTKGICFVRYECREDAIRAVDGLKGDRQIALREHTKKQRNGSNFERSQGSNNYGQQNCENTKFIHQFGRQNNQENGRSGYNRNGDKENIRNGNCNNDMPWGSSSANGSQKQNDGPWGSSSANGNQKQNDGPWGSSSANGNQKQNDGPWGSSSANGNQKQNDGPWGSSSANGNQKQNDGPWGSPNRYGNQKQNDGPWGSPNRNRNQKQHDVPWGLSSPNENQNQKDLSRGSTYTNENQRQNDTFQGPKNSYKYQVSNDGLPDLVDRNSITMTDTPNQSTDIPELVTADGRSLTSNNPIKKQYFTAQEVIVANIHPNFGAPYILHLLDRFEPLAISNVMVEPRTGKRYCHVYFKSAKESQEVENSFDKKLLQDQRLIVIQSKRLVEAAYFK